MSAVTSSGLGSGLDVTSIINQLMSIEQQPLNNLKKAESSINSKISSFGKIQSGLASLRDKAAAFSSSGLWGLTTTTLADASVATVTAVSGQEGLAGSHSLQVNALATSQTVSSQVFSSASSTLSDGTLTIELGAWSGGSPATGFTSKSGSSPIVISVGPGESSLTTIRDKINLAGAGVTASVVNDASGSRLSIRSANTGAENGFRISVAESVDDGVDTTGLSALAYDARNVSSMTRNQVAANSQVLLDGMLISSSTNTLDSVLQGVSIKLQKTTSSPVEMTSVQDNSSLKAAINDFVTAFNGLADTLKNETKYDAATKTAGKLQADRTALAVQSQLRSVLGVAFSGAGSGSMTHLSNAGISLNSSGKLEVKVAVLDDALKKPEQVKNLFTGGDGASSATTGFMKRFRKFVDAVQGADGPLSARSSGLKADLKRNTDQQDVWERRLTSTEARLKKQYDQLDRRMSNLTSIGNSVNLMVASLYG